MSSIVTVAEIVDAVEETLSAAGILRSSQSFATLTEGLNDLPCLQVYPDTCTTDAASSNDRTAFQAGIRQKSLILFADFYAHQRANLPEDMSILVEGISQLDQICDAQRTKPYFDLEAIRAFSYQWKRLIFEYNDPKVQYMGARFTLTLRLF